MPLNYEKKLIPRAKDLRGKMTKQEKHLWYDFLSSLDVRFQRQKTIDNYIVDFYCHKLNLVIEIDGSQHYTDDGIGYDEERTKILNAYGLQVIRFTNKQVDTQFKYVCDTIKKLTLQEN